MATKTAPKPKKQRINTIGLQRVDYNGSPTTLCKGCGHDSISARIIDACFQLSIEPESVMKMSGIGCSSKTPAYWLNRAHGFNATHGRMPSVTTGAVMANHQMTTIAVSGDGDTGSIGLGQFKHIMRRNVRMVYIVENNGVYGLTKGQFSATTDIGQQNKYYGVNDLPSFDLAMEAIVAGATFVARSFAGDPKQVTQLLKAAISHRGVALLDIVSPCVTFNDHDASNMSYSWGREHEDPLHDITFVMPQEEIVVDYEPGEVRIVEMHDGSHLQLRKIDEDDYDPTDKIGALRMLEHGRQQQELVTGLVYVDESRPSFAEVERLGDTPIAHLAEDVLRPSRKVLERAMDDFSF